MRFRKLKYDQSSEKDVTIQLLLDYIGNTVLSTISFDILDTSFEINLIYEVAGTMYANF